MNKLLCNFFIFSYYKTIFFLTIQVQGEVMAFKNSVLRIKQIIKIFAFYGFGFIVDSKLNHKQSSPENLRKAFEELGPTFIKIGQILSTRPDLLPKKYIDELSKLQDSAPEESYDKICEVFYNEFHNSIDDTFLYFDKTPLACASISQVHDAIINDGRLVVVKIQRPETVETMRMDLNIMRKILRLTKAKFIDAPINPMEVLDEIIASTKLELNFINEVNNMIKFKTLNKNVSFVSNPDVIEDLCTKKVVTMEKITGYKIDDTVNLLKADYDLNDIGKKLALSYFKQVLEDGFFHGDPHPGNLIIRDGTICFIDFGIMGNLSDFLKSALNDALLAVALKDINKIISFIMSIGEKKGFIDRNLLYEDIDRLLENYLYASLKNIKISLLLQELFDTAKRNNIQLPKDLTILIKSLVIIEGVISTLSPDLSLLDIAIPYIKANNKSRLLNNIDIDETLLMVLNFVTSTSKLPSQFLKLSDNIISGRAKIKLEHTNLEKSISHLHRMINRVVSAFIISSMIIGSSFILASNIGFKIYNISIIGISGFIAAAILGFWLLIYIIKSGML